MRRTSCYGVTVSKYLILASRYIYELCRQYNQSRLNILLLTHVPLRPKSFQGTVATLPFGSSRDLTCMCVTCVASGIVSYSFWRQYQLWARRLGRKSSLQAVIVLLTELAVKRRPISQPREILVTLFPPLNGGVFGASVPYTAVRWPTRSVSIPGGPGR